MRLNVKVVVVAAAMWTAALGFAAGLTIGGSHAWGLWSVLSAAVACWASAALALDYVAQQTAKYIVDTLSSEHAEIRKETEACANRTVERLANKQDKTIERMVGELADALSANGATPIRPR